MLEPDARPRLTRPSDVRAWIAEHQFLPSKVLGQNFLIDENILRIMVDAAELKSDDVVLEVGPGLGVVTGLLIERAARVVAIEKDKRLYEHLGHLFNDKTNLTLIRADALELNPDELIRMHGINKMVANLPYAVASRILVDFMMLPRGIDILVVTVQLEVAERICARVDTADYGLLSIWSQLDYGAKIIKRISPSCFHPRPQVTSAIVALRRTGNNRAQLRDPDLFDQMIKFAFSRRRKQIGTILHGFKPDGDAALTRAGIDTKRRPETIAVEEWIRLANELCG